MHELIEMFDFSISLIKLIDLEYRGFYYFDDEFFIYFLFDCFYVLFYLQSSNYYSKIFIDEMKFFSDLQLVLWDDSFCYVLTVTL